MADGGKVIFERRFLPYSVLVMAGIVVMGVIIGFYDGRPSIGVQVGAIGLLIMLAVLYGASSLAGRRQLAKIVLDGDGLLVRRVHFLDRGEEIRMPLAEITGWQARNRRFKHQSYTDISFAHGGERFAFYLSDEAHPDMDAIAALIPADAWTE